MQRRPVASRGLGQSYAGESLRPFRGLLGGPFETSSGSLDRWGLGQIVPFAPPPLPGAALMTCILFFFLLMRLFNKDENRYSLYFADVWVCLKFKSDQNNMVCDCQTILVEADGNKVETPKAPLATFSAEFGRNDRDCDGTAVCLVSASRRGWAFRSARGSTGPCHEASARGRGIAVCAWAFGASSLSTLKF